MPRRQQQTLEPSYYWYIFFSDWFKLEETFVKILSAFRINSTLSYNCSSWQINLGSFPHSWEIIRRQNYLGMLVKKKKKQSFTRKLPVFFASFAKAHACPQPRATPAERFWDHPVVSKFLPVRLKFWSQSHLSNWL